MPDLDLTTAVLTRSACARGVLMHIQWGPPFVRLDYRTITRSHTLVEISPIVCLVHFLNADFELLHSATRSLQNGLSGLAVASTKRRQRLNSAWTASGRQARRVPVGLLTASLCRQNG